MKLLVLAAGAALAAAQNCTVNDGLKVREDVNNSLQMRAGRTAPPSARNCLRNGPDERSAAARLHAHHPRHARPTGSGRRASWAAGGHYYPFPGAATSGGRSVLSATNKPRLPPSHGPAAGRLRLRRHQPADLPVEGLLLEPLGHQRRPVVLLRRGHFQHVLCTPGRPLHTFQRDGGGDDAQLLPRKHQHPGQGRHRRGAGLQHARRCVVPASHASASGTAAAAPSDWRACVPPPAVPHPHHHLSAGVRACCCLQAPTTTTGCGTAR